MKLGAKAEKFGKGQTLHIILNCEKWTLTFEMPQGKVLGKPMDIEEGDRYYAAIDFDASYSRGTGGYFDFELIF